ncbi:putative 28S rRNA (cytosine-C(5))-methyltransferase [Homalodisca vitripennis]|nr:putative 28S rRNA (cytosine-C(5))-methyltransferase [Homalodisca vitripennis]
MSRIGLGLDMNRNTRGPPHQWPREITHSQHEYLIKFICDAWNIVYREVQQTTSNTHFVPFDLKALWGYRTTILHSILSCLIFLLPGVNESSIISNLIRYVRVNTIKDDVESVIGYFSEEGWQLIETADSYQSYLDQLRELKPGGDQFLQDFHIPEVLVFPPGTALYQHHLYKNGTLHFMDKVFCEDLGVLSGGKELIPGKVLVWLVPHHSIWVCLVQLPLPYRECTEHPEWSILKKGELWTE